MTEFLKRPIALLLLNIALALFTTIYTVQALHMDHIVRQRLEHSRLTLQQKQQVVNGSTAASAYVATAVFVPVLLLIVSGALFVFGLMTRPQPGFSSMFAMVSRSFVPYFLISAILSIVILATAADKSALDVDNLLPTNLAAFANKLTITKPMYAIERALDLLSFLEIGLLSFGFSRLTKTSIFTGVAAVAALWALYVSAGVILTLLQ